MSKTQGGSFRRRRSHRRVDALAQEPGRELNPNAATAHIRVLDGTVPPAGGSESPELAPEELQHPPVDQRPPGFHVRAVPIDEPFS